MRYAEETLDVHGPWQEAQRRLDSHASASERVTQNKAQIRGLKQTIEDRRRDIAAEAPSAAGYPSGVQARRDFVKLLVESDGAVSAAEDMIAVCQSVLEDAQAELRHHELGLSVLTARMTELGGLLHFYAEAKSAQTARLQHLVMQPTQPEQQEKT